MPEIAARIRSSVRALRRAPRFTVPALVSLAFGIGAALPLLGLVRLESLVPSRIASPLALDHVPDVRIAGAAGEWERSAAELQDAAFEGMLALLAAVALLVLAVACVNVAVLLLGRGSARRREIAVRRALGAGRRRIVPAHLLEGVLLGLAGGAAGLALGSLAAPVLRGAWPYGTVEGASAGTGGALGAAGIALLVVVAGAGASPLLVGWARDLRGALAVGERATPGRRERALRNAFVVAQFAAALALVGGAGLLARNSLPLSDAATLGYDPRDTLVVRLAAVPVTEPPVRADHAVARAGGAARAGDGESALIAAFDALAAGIRRVDGVRAVGVGTPGAWLGLGAVRDVLAECRCVRGNVYLPYVPATARHHVVGPGFFRALGVPVIDGRASTEGDGGESPPVVVVNEAFARENFPRQPFVGREVFLDRRGEPYTVVGVVGDVRARGIGTGRGAAPAVYLAARQHPPRPAALVVRTAGDPADFAPALRSAVARAGAGFTVAAASPLLEELARFAAPVGWFGDVFTGLAALALVLATYGLFTATRLHVSRRTREIGVRMALGARQAEVVAAAVRDGARLAGLGLTLGFFGAAALARALQLMFDGVRLVDPVLLGGVSATLAAAVLGSTLSAARRAARVDPAVALRGE